MKKENLAIFIGILGLIGMFFFPSPEENFIFYIGFIIFIVGLIVWVLKIKTKGK